MWKPQAEEIIIVPEERNRYFDDLYPPAPTEPADSLQRRNSTALSFARKRRTFMSEKDIHETASFVRSFNITKTKEDMIIMKEYLHKYLEHSKNPPKHFDRSEWQSYLELGNIRFPDNDEEKNTFYKEWLQIIVKKLSNDRPLVIEAYELALKIVPSQVFTDKCDFLIQSTDALIALIESKDEILVRSKISICVPLLLALHETFVVLQEASKNFVETHHDYFKSVMNHLAIIKKEQKYYPVYFLASVLEQEFKCVEKGENIFSFNGWFRKSFSGVRPLINISHSGLNMETRQNVLELMLKTAQNGLTATKRWNERWVDRMKYINALALKSCYDASFYELFELEADTIFNAKPDAMFAAQDLKTEQYMIAGQYQLLAYESPDQRTRNRAFDFLLSFAEQYRLKNSAADPDVYEALLNALGYLYNIVGDEKREKIDVSFETMLDTPEKKLRMSYYSWCGMNNLRDKLSQYYIYEERLKVSKLHETVLKEVDKDMHLEFDKVQNRLKEFYKDDEYGIIPSLLAENGKRHVKDFDYYIGRFEVDRDRFKRPEWNRDSESDDDELDLDHVDDHLLCHYQDAHMLVKTIDIEDIFNAHSLLKGYRPKQIKKIVLFGNPGVGKTSLIKKIAYYWSMGEWGKKLDFVYVLPVKELGKDRYDGKDIKSEPKLATAIVNLCFKYRDDDDFLYLQKKVQDSLEEIRTVVILDGLDERFEVCEEIIDEAKTSGCRLILCGRPFDLVKERKIACNEIECVGFHDDHLLKFISNAVEESEDLCSILKQNRKLWKWMHAPIIADMVCFYSNVNKGWYKKGNSFKSIHSVYHNIVKCLWKEFESKSWTEFAVTDVYNSLYKIAYESFKENKILVDPSSIEAEGYNSLKEVAQGGGFYVFKLKEKLCHFPHRTFQECFAGQYLVKCIEGEDQDATNAAREFINENKYSPQHEVVIRFFVEGIASSGKLSFDDLFLIMDSGFKDFLEWNHSFFKLWVLDGWLCASSQTIQDLRAKSENVRKILAEVQQIIRCSFDDFLMFTTLIERLSKCEEALNQLPELQTSIFDQFKTCMATEETPALRPMIDIVVELSCLLPSKKEEIVEVILKTMEEGPKRARRCAQWTATGLTKSVPSMAEKIVEQIASMTDHTYWRIRLIAAGQLANLAGLVPQKVDLMIEKVLKLMKDKNEEVINFAGRQISRLARNAPQAAKKITEEVYNLMFEKERRPRKSACDQALTLARLVPEMKTDIVKRIIQLMEDDTWHVRRSATDQAPGLVLLEPNQAAEIVRLVKFEQEDPDLLVREAGHRSANKIAYYSPQFCKTLGDRVLQLMRCFDWRIRNTAVEQAAFASVYLPELAEEITEQTIETFTDEDWFVCESALRKSEDLTQSVPHLSDKLGRRFVEIMEQTDIRIHSTVFDQALKLRTIVPQYAKRLQEAVGRMMEKLDWEKQETIIQKSYMLAKEMPMSSDRLVEEVIELTDNGDFRTRILVAELAPGFSLLHPEYQSTFARRIITLYGDEDMRVRAAAARSTPKMVRIYHNLARTLLTGLIKLLNDEEWYTRNYAETAVPNSVLGCDPKVLKPFCKYLVDNNHDPRDLLSKVARYRAFLALPAKNLVRVGKENYNNAVEICSFYFLKRRATYSLSEDGGEITVVSRDVKGKKSTTEASQHFLDFLKNINSALKKACTAKGKARIPKRQEETKLDIQKEKDDMIKKKKDDAEAAKKRRYEEDFRYARDD